MVGSVVGSVVCSVVGSLDDVVVGSVSDSKNSLAVLVVNSENLSMVD